MPGKLSLLTTVSISVLMICASGSAAAHRKLPMTHARGAVDRVIAAAPGLVTLYDQSSDDSGVGVLSENFYGYDSYDAYGADDFAVPAGHKWKIRQVEVAGVYEQDTNPAQSENVLFYKAAKGLPGSLVAECDELPGIDNDGSFAIKIPKSCSVTLKGGFRYWVSVVVNENHVCCTDWKWETRSGQLGKAAAWENPGGVWGRCVEWGVMTECIGDHGEGPDFMFALKGKDIKL